MVFKLFKKIGSGLFKAAKWATKTALKPFELLDTGINAVLSKIPGGNILKKIREGVMKAEEILSGGVGTLGSSRALLKSAKEIFDTVDKVQAAKRLQNATDAELQQIAAKQAAYVKRGQGHKMIAAGGQRQAAGGGRVKLS